MSLLLPRIDRETAMALIELHREAAASGEVLLLPDLPEVVTYTPVGGTRVPTDATLLGELRTDLLQVAREHGMPGAITDMTRYEGRSARMLHARLTITPHEASHEEVWSFLTSCWLLDIAMWRFGPEADIKRFLGDVNRNTFRRMWWRAEVFGPDIDLEALREDELVSIMERPTLSSDRRLARAIAREFLRRVAVGEAPERMLLMRESSKRILRLTPFVSFDLLPEDELARVVSDVFEDAAAGLAGRPAERVQPESAEVPAPSPDVVVLAVDQLRGTTSSDGDASHDGELDIRTLADVALDLARATGRVANKDLREVAGITSDEAREVFRLLMEEGQVARKGAKRGTHYVIAEPSADVPSAPVGDQHGRESDMTPARPQGSTLRRFLRGRR